MRRFWIGLVLLLLCLGGTSACLPRQLSFPEGIGRISEMQPPATPSPRPALHLELAAGAAPARLARLLLQDMAEAGCDAVLVEPGQPAELYVGYDPPPGFLAWPLTVTRFIPVVSFWLPITEVSYTDLERIFQGQVGDWSELGSPRSEAIVPLSPQVAPGLPLPALPGASTGTPLPDVDALAAALDEFPGGIALVPLEQVDPRLRALRVDGRDPLLEDEAPLQEGRPLSPLDRALSLAISPQVPPDLLGRFEAVAREQRVVPAPPAIELIFVGDVIPGRTVERKILAYGGDYTLPFAHTAAALRQGDLTVGSLDSALSDRISPPTDPYTYYFVASGRFCEGLLQAGFDAMTLATNHSMNFGAEGLSDTIALLEGSGIVPFGGGMNLEQARRPALFELKGVTFALLGYDDITYEYYGAGESWAGTAPADAEWVAADIAAARARADVVIPYFHWGWEYTREPSPRQQQLAHLAVEAGADVVMGSHPHWVQTMERYQGAAVLYSLGNFVFDQMWSLETRQGAIAHLIFRGNRLVNVRLQAVLIEDYFQPRLLPASQAEEIYRAVQWASPAWTR